MKERARRLGRQAEYRVSEWAAAAGMTPTRPGVDVHGWDLLLELQLASRSQADGNADLAKCLVQIKGTDTTSKRMPVRLDNWLNLALAPMPSYFLVLEYDGKQEPQRAYLVHVWEDLIAAALKRQRQVEAAGKKIQRGMKMNLKWSFEELLEECSGIALCDALCGSIGPSSHDYLLRKIDLIRTVGYDATRHAGEITFGGSSDHALLEDLARHAIGEKEFIDVQGFTMAERRFGIELPATPPFAVAKAKISVRPSPTKAIVTISNQKRTQVVHEQCDVLLATAVFPFLPPEYRFAKIQNEYLRIVIDPSRKKFGISATLPPYDEIVPLDALARTATVMQMMADRDEEGLLFEVRSPASAIRIEQRQISATNFDLSVLPLLLAIRDCEQLFDRLGCSKSTAVTLAEIGDAARRVSGVLTLLKEPDADVRYSFNMQGDVAPDSGIGAALFVAAVEIGGYFVGGVFSARGRVTFTRDNEAAVWKGTIADCVITVVDTQVSPRGDDALDQLRDRARKAVAALEASGVDDVFLIDLGD